MGLARSSLKSLAHEREVDNFIDKHKTYKQLRDFKLF